MKNLIAAAFLALALAGCDKVVSRTPVGEPYTHTGTQSCSAGPGHCYACGMGMDGFKCSWDFKYSCPGDQPVTREWQDVEIVYESGKRLVHHESVVISVDGVCH